MYWISSEEKQIPGFVPFGENLWYDPLRVQIRHTWSLLTTKVACEVTRERNDRAGGRWKQQMTSQPLGQADDLTTTGWPVFNRLDWPAGYYAAGQWLVSGCTVAPPRGETCASGVWGHATTQYTVNRVTAMSQPQSTCSLSTPARDATHVGL